jgi:hypothetical protein
MAEGTTVAQVTPGADHSSYQCYWAEQTRMALVEIQVGDNRSLVQSHIYQGVDLYALLQLRHGCELG